MRWRTGSVVYRDGAWWARVQYLENGKRREIRRRPRPFELNSKQRAKDFLETLIREFDRGPSRDVTLSEVCKQFIASACIPPVYENGQKIRGMSDGADCKRFLEAEVVYAPIGAKRITELTYVDLRALRDARLEAPKKRGGTKVIQLKGRRSIASTNREMGWIRRVIGFALDAGYISRNPMKVSRGKALIVNAAESPRERILTKEEEALMLFHYRSRSVDFFVFLLDTGMRRGEALALKTSDCDLKRGVVIVPWEIAKTKKARVIPMSGRVRKILAQKKSGRVFDLSLTIVRNDFRRARKAAGVKDLRLHDLRATLTTRLIQNGLSEAEAAQITGHRIDPRTEIAKTLRKHYLRVDDVTMKKAAGILDAL